MRILIVEDEQKLNLGLKRGLECEGRRETHPKGETIFAPSP